MLEVKKRIVSQEGAEQEGVTLAAEVVLMICASQWIQFEGNGIGQNEDFLVGSRSLQQDRGLSSERPDALHLRVINKPLSSRTTKEALKHRTFFKCEASLA